MVDTSKGFNALGTKTSALNDNQSVELPEYLPKETSKSRNTLPMPEADHVVTPLLGDITPMGVGEVSVVEPEASFAESFSAGIAPTARAWGAGFYENLRFGTDINYTDEQKKEVRDQFSREYGITSKEEIDALTTDIKSFAHHQHRLDRILNKRMDNKAIADNPWVGVPAGLLDADSALGFVPYAGQGYLAAKIGVGATRIAKGVAGAGIAYGINAYVEDSDLRTDDERMFDPITYGVLGLLSPIAKSGNTALDTAIQAEIDVIGRKPSTPITPSKGRNVAPDADTLHNKDLLSDSIKGTTVGGKADDFIKASSATLASGERMLRYLDYDVNHPAAKLLASARTQGDNAIYAAGTVQANLDHRLMSFSDNLREVTQRVYNTNRLLGHQNHADKMRLVQLDYIRHTQRLDDDVLRYQTLNNRLPSPEEINRFIKESDAPDHIKELQATYVKTGFAEEAFDYIKHAGLLDEATIEKLVRRPTYTPVRHSYQRMRSLLKSNAIKQDDLFNFLGRQIQRMYPEVQDALGKQALSAHTLGKNFYNTQKEMSVNLVAITSGGFTKSSMADLLMRSGLEEERAYKVVDSMFDTKTGSKIDGGTHKNLKQRMNWDWEDAMVGSDGKAYGMADIIDNDLVKNLQDYSRSMSHRIGNAHYGIKNQADLDKLLEDLLDNRPANVSHSDAKRFLSGVRQQLLGQPVGEAMSPIERSATTIGGAMVLSGSGIWALNELTSQIARVGFVRSFPHMLKALKPAFGGLRGVNKTDLNSLSDIIIGRLGGTGAWQHVMTRADDAFEITGDVHATIAHHGQATRFMNGSEAVRRYQVGMLAGVFEDAFKGVAAGKAADVKYLRETMKFNDELIQGIKTEYSKHGGNIDAWDMDVRLDTMQRIQYETENLAMNIRSGESPAFMEHRSIGKVLFPFMSYGFAMQEKMLRNSYQRGGALAVGFMFAVQFPVAILLGAINNIKNGKEWDDNLQAGAINAFSILGAANYPMSLALSGFGSSGGAAMIPVDSAMKLGAKIVNPDAEVTLRDIARVTPLYSATILPLLISAVEEGN